jgi:putative ABC transport system permease protein
MKRWALAYRWLRRDLTAGELSVVAVALIVAIAAMTSVGFFADRVHKAMGAEANQLLAADLVVSADHLPPADIAAEIDQLHMQRGATAIFPSMVLAGEQSQLVNVKAVSSSYPLRGHVHLSLQGKDTAVEGAPPPGTAWADQRLFDTLGVRPGATINLGEATLKLAAVIVREPDTAIDLYNFVPRLLINDHDLPATKLIQPGSRVRYRILAAGDAGQVDALRAWVKPHLGRGERLEDIRESRPELRTALDRAERFLRLSALMGVFLAAAAIALAARRYTERHLDAVALLRTLGMVQSQIVALFLRQFAAMALLAVVVGVGCGWLVQFALAYAIRGVFDRALPAAGFEPALAGAAVGVTLLLGFCLPPLLRLRNVSALRVLRRDVLPPGNAPLVFGLGVAALAGLIAWQAADAKLALIVLSGFAGTVLVAMAAAWGLVWLTPRLPLPASAGWRFGLANVARRRGLSVAQIVALCLGLMALMLLTVVRNDLLASWQQSVPADAPNRFIINIQPDQREQLAAEFRAANITVPNLAPMIRSRLISIAGRPVGERHYKGEQAKRLAEREFNLSWGEPERDDNRTEQGRALAETDKGWAVEESMANTLGIKLGDVLVFDIAGTQFKAPVLSIRKVNWDSFRVNFFVVGTQALLRDQPASYVVSFHLNDSQTAFVTQLTRKFPNMTVVDVSVIVSEVQHVLDRVLAAVQVVFAFSLFAGLSVLYAATLATHDERKRDAAILRTLGASRAVVRQAASAELLLVGGLAGLLAAGAALATGFAAAKRLLDLPPHVSWWLLPVGLLAGAFASRLAATPLLNRVLRTPPLRALR